MTPIDHHKPGHEQSVIVTHGAVLRLSLPMMLAYASTPMVGLVDTALMGQLGVPTLIGGVAIATIIIEVVLATMNFLRSGTTGLTAQAVGARHRVEESAIVLRAALLAVLLGTTIVVFSPLIAMIGFAAFAAGGPEVEAAGRIYFDIRIWAAPMMLFNYVTLGWLLGRGEAGVALLLQLFLNGINIAASVWLVLGLNYGIAGNAWGTVIAECLTAMVGAVLIFRRLRRSKMPPVASVFDLAAIRRMLWMNGDMAIRSFTLLMGLSFFTQQSATYGEVVLAANTVLLRFYVLCSITLDGIAVAAEQLAGQAVGARNRKAFDRVVVLTRYWGLALAALVALVIFAFGPAVINLLTTSEPVRSAALEYLPWTVSLSLFGVLAYQMDGIFIGATWTRDMRNMMLLSLVVYFAVWAVLAPVYGPHGLWAAFLVFHAARSVTYTIRQKTLARRTFGPASG